MQNYSNEEIIAGLKNCNNLVLCYVYENYFKIVRVLITKNNGSYEDAQDIFQEALVRIYKKSLNPEFELTCAFSTFLYSVARYLWLKELERRRRMLIPEGDVKFDVMDTDNLSEGEMKCIKAYAMLFNRLSEECKRILHLHFNKIPINEITTILNLSSAQQTMDKKYRCKKRLINAVTNHPALKLFLYG